MALKGMHKKILSNISYPWEALIHIDKFICVAEENESNERDASMIELYTVYRVCNAQCKCIDTHPDRNDSFCASYVWVKYHFTADFHDDVLK